MIIQALDRYYEHLTADDDSDVAPPGYSRAPVSYALNLSEYGNLLDIIDLREEGGKKPRSMIVPEQAKRSGVNVTPNFLCDNCGYVLGIGTEGKPERLSKKFSSFVAFHEEILGGINDIGGQALLAFLQTWDPESAFEDPSVSAKKEDLLRGGNIVFMLHGDTCFLHERTAIRVAWARYRNSSSSAVIGQCLVTGNIAPLARIHPAIKGVTGSKSTGGSLVSFNLNAFESYGKEQSFNAPVSEEAAFAYTTAVNYLLADKRHRIRIGDATAIFWAERTGPEEDLLAELLDPSWDAEKEDKKDEDRLVRDPQTVRLVREVLSRIRDQRHVPTDALEGVDLGVRLFILGMSPNAARLAIRFWMVDTFGGLVEKISQHYVHMTISRQYSNNPDYIPLWRILKATAPQGDLKHVSPLLAGAIARSILLGLPYPHVLYTAILGRLRAGEEIDYVRAATIKACMIRNRLHGDPITKKVVESVSLDEESTSTAYRLGRLFALMEKAQQDASPNINATIRDRYFGAASATPRTVFPQLLRLSQHHISKSEYGSLVDRKIQDVVNGLNAFPARLSLEDQGLFVLGYYHQRNALYQKSDKKEGKE
jgi:CRISPR-associated protein Csd1